MTETRASQLRRAPLGVKFKLLYGSGGLIESIVTAALTYFLLYYLTAVCGLSGTRAGAAMFIGLMVDAVADPVIGLVSDNTITRWGRRLPYMVIGTVPLAAAFGLLFSIPASLTGLPLFVYALLCAMAVRIGQSVYNLPYVAVGAEVTDDYLERSSIVSYRVTFSMIGTFLVIGLGLGVFMAGDGTLDSRAAYVPFGWACALIIVVAGLGGAYSTAKVLPRLHGGQLIEGAAVPRFIRELRDIFRNRSFVLLFLATLAFFVAQGMAGALALYLNRYFWGLPASAVQLVLIGSTLGPFVGVPLTVFLSRKFDKKPLTIVFFLIFVTGQAWPPIARVADILTREQIPVIIILVCNAALAGAALVGAAIGAQSMMADAVDEHEHLFGVRREGLFFSGLAFGVKAASGLGGLLAGIALDFIRFPTATAADGKAVSLSAEVVANLGLVSGPLPAAITALAPIILLAYTLNRARHAAILRSLEARRAA